MNKKKSLQELTFKDNFMFGAVMLDPENCKGILERSLGIPIERVEVSKEKSIVYNPEYKGIRLDAYARDADQTRYNVEMQVLQMPELQKRVRYYHSQIDMEILLSGLSYEELPDTYVIFICDFDPFGEGKYRYTRKCICKEVPELEMEDGAYTIFLSTHGINEEEEPEELVNFLKFAGGRPSDNADGEDPFIKKLQDSIREVKESREMGARYMTFQELLKDEREAGRAEGRAEGIALGEKNTLAYQVKKKLEKQQTVAEIADALEQDVVVIEAMIAELQSDLQ